MIEDKPEEATSSLEWCTTNVETAKKKEVVEISGETQATFCLHKKKTFLINKYYD